MPSNKRQVKGIRGKYRMIERRYVIEYVFKRFKEAVWRGFNVRLGMPPEEWRKRYPELSHRWWKVWMAYADAVVVTDDAIWIIEAKIRNPRTAIGQLLDYRERLKVTPEFKQWLNRPIKLLLVIPIPAPEIESLAKNYGIEVDHYLPEWVANYMREVGLL